MTTEAAPPAASEVRDRILAVASDLFYRLGVHAVGVDLVVERAGVAKTSLYRHFKTKDDLIAAFLAAEDVAFWGQWDQVAARHAQDPAAELEAQLAWIAERVARPNYRGCPQLNVAAEFPAPEHPARLVAAAHKAELRRRLGVLAERMGVARADAVSAQLALIINGAFVSGQILTADEASEVLLSAARALVAAGRR